MSELNDMQAVIDAARETAEPHTLDPDKPQALLVPEGARVEMRDLKEWRERPVRKIGTYRPADVDSFVDYVTHHLTDDTTVWVHPTSGKVVAVFNDNGQTDPGWGDHRAALTLQLTDEWVYWTKADGVSQTQVSFAEHIEGGLNEIIEPDAADVLEIAQSFHAHTGASFRSSTRLQSGEQRLQYDETIDATAGPSGDMLVPTVIMLAIAPFYGEEPSRLTARLRFRLNNGGLLLSYKLDRPEAIVRDAITAIADRLRGSFGLTYIGEPAIGEEIPF